MADRLAGDLVVLERADNTALVVTMQPGGSQWIDLMQPGMQGIQSDLLQLLLYLVAKFPVGRWPVEQASLLRFQVERSASGEEHFPAP